MSSTTTMTEQRVSTNVSPPGFGATLASEWTKMVSLRSTYITLALGFFLSVGMTALLALAVGATYSEWTEADQATFDPITFAFSGWLFGAIVYIVFGVLLVSNEYSSKMMPLTLSVTPRRGRLMAAKLLLVTVVTLVAGVVTMIVMFFAAQIMFDLFNMPTVGLFDEDVPRAIIGSGALSPVFPLIGACLAFVLRSTAGAITAALGFLWLPSIVGTFLPRWWQENIIALLPGNAADALTISHIQSSNTMLDSMPLAAVVVAAWIVFFIALAYISLIRRDA